MGQRTIPPMNTDVVDGGVLTPVVGAPQAHEGPSSHPGTYEPQRMADTRAPRTWYDKFAIRTKTVDGPIASWEIWQNPFLFRTITGMLHGFFFPACLIGLGLLLLLDNLGLLHVSIWTLISVWWPVLLIGLGIALFFTPNRIRSKKDQHKS